MCLPGGGLLVRTMTDTTTQPKEPIEAAPTAAEPTAAAPAVQIDPKFYPPIAIVLLATAAIFWPLFKILPDVWFDPDTDYAHGAIVPILAALVIWDRWPQISKIPIKGSNLALLFAAPALYLAWFAHQAEATTPLAAIFVWCLLCGILFVAGWKWLAALFLPTSYLIFAFPVFDRLIDAYTTPIQHLSTTVSYQILNLIGQNPYRDDVQTIVLANFTLDVGVPCSGIKLLIAVIAITGFFVLVAKLGWWKNAILMALVLPLSVLINSIRIVAIGVVGNTWGHDAGHQFHDYSGYMSLVLCFAALYGLTKSLGWK